MIQIHYGCSEKNCTTPTCYSCHKRLKNVPVRRPTILTARTLAFLLASEDDPYAGLCPNRLLVSPEVVYTGEESALGILKQDQADKRTRELQTDKVQVKVASVTGALSDEVPTDNDIVSALVTVHEKKKTKPQRDRRSLTQNVFDTRGVKAFEWRMMKSPVDVLRGLSVATVTRARLQENGTQTRDNGDGPKKIESNGHAVRPRARSQSLKGKENAKADMEVPKSITNGTLHTAFKENDEETQPGREIETAPSPIQTSDHPASTRTSFESTAAPPRVPVMTGLSRTNLLELRGMAWESMMRCKSNDAVTQFYDAPAQYHLATTHKVSVEKLESAGTTHPLRMNGDMKNLIKITIIYNFADPSRLVQCFRHRDHSSDTDEDHAEDTDDRDARQRFIDQIIQKPPVSLGPLNFDLECLTLWKPTIGPLIFNCLWHSLGALFTPPPEIAFAKSPRLKPQKSSKEPEAKYLDDADAAHMILVAIFALVGSVEMTKWHTMTEVRNLRAWGRTLANSKQSGPPDDYTDPWLRLSDDLEYEPAVRLASRLVRAIAARRSFWLISKAARGPGSYPYEDKFPLMESIMGALVSEEKKTRRISGRTSLTFVFVEWIRTVMLKNWDGKPEVKRWDHFGAALEILSDLCMSLVFPVGCSVPRTNIEADPQRDVLQLTYVSFFMPFISENLSPEKALTDFAHRTPNNNTLNIFQFPWLFLPSFRVSYFRTLNFTKMSEAYQSASYHNILIEKMRFATNPPRNESSLYGDRKWNRHTFLENQLRPALSRYLVLDVRRDHLLEDAFDQLWGRERRELLRPLKLRMGIGGGGEAGVDHGGVSQEFFRIVFEKAFDPNAGLFVTDSQTRMSWFQPLSLEPLQTYELLGLLVSLAVYNGVMLPTTFPLVLYQKLLSKPGEEPRVWIDDGWPVLASSFGTMLNWTDGDVADVMVREYAFDFEANGQRHAVNMLKIRKDDPWPALDRPDCEDGVAGPSSAESEIPLVSNANREQYITDYIYWLTHKSIAPQFSAFARGFHTCLDAASLSLLSPYLLRTLAEGYAEFDITGLKGCAKYEDGYTRTHPTIMAFWEIVESYDISQLRKLLEFVTASDRVPVQGWRGVMFCVIRNGGDTEVGL
jgi:hypothetical protein